jgi:plasmid segregation protein ParM
MHKVGVDAGRSMVKATCNGEAVVEFPPLVAPAGASVALLDGRAERLEVAWEGARWLVGESVRGAGGARWVTDERKVGTDSLVLALAALGRLGIQGEIVLCAGVPAALWGTDGAALRRLLSGPFTFGWNGHQRAVSVTAYVLPEPAGAYFEALLDQSGRVADPEIARYPVAVVDIGYRSVDIVLLERGAIQEHVTRSTAHGLVTAFNRLYQRLASEVGLLTDDERMDVFLGVVRGDPVVLKGRPVGDGLRRVIESARPDVADAIVSDVRSALSGVNYRVLLWAGGGAEWLRAELDAAFPGGRWPQSPRLANVRGFYRYACMVASRPREKPQAGGESRV